MTIQFRIHENGNICCASTNSAGDRIRSEHECAKCKQHFAAIERRESLKTQEDILENNYAPPDSYGPAIAQLHTAEGRTAEQTFADEWAAKRRRELDAEHAEIDAHIAATPAPRLTAAELAAYTPPDPYAAGIKALKEKSRS